MSIRFFWYRSKRHQDVPFGYVMFKLPHVRGTLWLCCVHIDQLITYPAVYLLLFTLQLCYKPYDILQGVTKSWKAHISNHDGLQNFLTSTFFTIAPRFSKSGTEWQKSALPSLNTKFAKQKIFYFLTQSIHHINTCRKPSFLMNVSLILTIILEATLSLVQQVFIKLIS